MKDIVDPVYDPLTQNQKERILSELAYWFTKNGRTECSITDVMSRVFAVHGHHGLTAESDAKQLAEAVVLRSGVLKEVTPDSIQFLHKTFQEYLCAVAVVWHEDERHVANDFDLRNWGELFLITVSMASRRVANEMVKALLERSDAEKRGSSAYLLLAAASARESIGVEEAIRKQISDQVEQLIPPRESGLVFELAEAGDLVVPFLGYRDSFDNTDVSRMIMLLGLIDNREADRLLAGYAQDVEIDVEIVDCFMRALDYKADQDLVKKIIDLMKQKSSTRFWTGRRGGILHVASNGLLSYSHVLPPAKCIVFDGRFGLDLIRGFNIEWRAQDKINCLMMLEPQGFLPARMERFKGVRELVFVRAFIDELDASTAIGQLKTIRRIDTEIADWDSLAYAELERLYVAGSVTAKQVYHEQIDLKKFAKTVYATNDFVQTFEALEERHGSGYDTWLLQMWEQHEFESLIHDMGMDGALHEGAGRDGS